MIWGHSGQPSKQLKQTTNCHIVGETDSLSSSLRLSPSRTSPWRSNMRWAFGLGWRMSGHQTPKKRSQIEENKATIIAGPERAATPSSLASISYICVLNNGNSLSISEVYKCILLTTAFLILMCNRYIFSTAGELYRGNKERRKFWLKMIPYSTKNCQVKFVGIFF